MGFIIYQGNQDNIFICHYHSYFGVSLYKWAKDFTSLLGESPLFSFSSSAVLNGSSALDVYGGSFSESSSSSVLFSVTAPRFTLLRINCPAVKLVFDSLEMMSIADQQASDINQGQAIYKTQSQTCLKLHPINHEITLKVLHIVDGRLLRHQLWE